jgi:hypothetical protein
VGGALGRLTGVAPHVHGREPHVVEGGEVREEIVKLEDHAHAGVQRSQRGPAG